MLVFWKDASEKSKAFRVLLIKLSKAFDCICHDLLIAKLHAYGLDISFLNLLQDYLSKSKIVDPFFSSRENIFCAVLQGTFHQYFYDVEYSLHHWTCR